MISKLYFHSVVARIVTKTCIVAVEDLLSLRTLFFRMCAKCLIWFLGDIDVEVNHYAVLGLPSREEGGKISEEKINKASGSKLRELHRD